MEFTNASYVYENFDPYFYGDLPEHSGSIYNKTDDGPSTGSFVAMTILAITYTLVMIVCGAGNFLLCCVIVRFRRMRTTTNLLIGNLALSDFLVAVMCVPFNFYFNMANTWPFGRVMCMLVGYLKMTSFYVSVNSLLAIAIDRYIIIMHPLKPRMTIFTAGIVICCIWFVSLGVVIPSAVHIKTVSFYDGSVKCQEMIFSRVLKAYTMMLFIVEFLVPLIVMIVVYYLIAKRLWFRHVPGEHVTEEQELAAEVSKRRTIRTLVIVVSLFALCWAPYHCLAIVRDIFIPSIHADHVELFTTLYYMTEALAMGNSLVNTFIYVIFNANFRKYVLQLPESFRSRSNREMKRSWHRLAMQTVSRGSTRSSQLRNSGAVGRGSERYKETSGAVNDPRYQALLVKEKDACCNHNGV